MDMFTNRLENFSKLLGIIDIVDVLILHVHSKHTEHCNFLFSLRISQGVGVSH